MSRVRSDADHLRGAHRACDRRGARQYHVYLVLPDALAPYRLNPADAYYPQTEMPVRASVAINGPRDFASTDFRVQSSGLISGFVASQTGSPRQPGADAMQHEEDDRDDGEAQEGEDKVV